MTKQTKWLLVAVLVVYAVLIALSAKGQDLDPPYECCVDKTYYTRSCETSPYSIAGGTPGYAGQICGAHTWAWVGDDLFTYALMDQGGKSYKRPPLAAGPIALKVWDDCYVKHLNTWPMGQMCLTAVAPAGTQNYFPIDWSHLPPGPQKTAWGNKYGCFTVPTQTPTSVPTPVQTPSGCPPCPSPTMVPTPCPCP